MNIITFSTLYYPNCFRLHLVRLKEIHCEILRIQQKRNQTVILEQIFFSNAVLYPLIYAVTETNVFTCIVPSPESQHMLVFRDEEFCVLKFGAFFSTSLRGAGEAAEQPKAIVAAQLYSGDVITVLLRDPEQLQQVVLAQFPLIRVDEWQAVAALRADWRIGALDAG